MKEQKRFLVFTLVLFALAVAECLLTPLFGLLTEAVPLSVYAVRPLSRLLAVCAPFLTLGVAADAVHKRGFSYGLAFVGIYAGLELLFAVPLSLIAYDVTYSAPYILTLLIYMLTAVVGALILLGCLCIGYLLFLRGSAAVPIAFRQSPAARTVGLSAAALSLYYLTVEIIDFISYAKDRLWILMGADLFDFCYFVLWILLCGAAAVAIGCFGAKRLSVQE